MFSILFKLVLPILLGYVGYRMFKRILLVENKSNETRLSQRKNHPPQEELMVKEPNCQVFVPVSSAYTKVIHGKEEHFCGKTCADEFMSKQKQ